MGNPSQTPQLKDLVNQMHHMLTYSLAPSTQRTYSSCFNKYLSFCKTHALNSLPSVEHNLMLFATHLSNSTSFSNIKLHLAAIRHQDILWGYGNDTPKPRLFMLLRAIKRAQNKKYKRPKRIPITPLLLIKFHQFLASSNLSTTNRCMLWAAATSAFFGFLRSSEFVSPTTRNFDPLSTLLFTDAHISNIQKCTLEIKSSKTDPFRYGCSIRLAPTYNSLCPVKALTEYLILHPTKEGPLFTYEDGSYLTQRRLNTILKSALPSNINNPISSHSFRIGAATTAASANIPSWLIKQLGRWNSNCYQIYIRIPDSTIDNTCTLLAKTMLYSHTWDPETMIQ